MIRHKATGAELAWRPTRDHWGDEGTGWALSPIGSDEVVAFAYPLRCLHSSALFSGPDSGTLVFSCKAGETKESMLRVAVERGVVEIIPDELPASEEKDYDAVHRAGEAEQRSVYVEALTVVAAHEWSTVELRSAAICELRRLALEDR